MLLLVAAVARDGRERGLRRTLLAGAESSGRSTCRTRASTPRTSSAPTTSPGHLAHNVNLSAKAIVAPGRVCAGSPRCAATRRQAAEYRKLAEQFAARWIKEADDGDHYRLAFDRPGTWSQKYNLVWDRLLGLEPVPGRRSRRKEMAYYRKVQERYGLPLDNRRLYTKLDWITWTATLTGSRADFEALVNPVFDFLNTTPNRVPMTDWYWTHDATKSGFQARSVVGGSSCACWTIRPCGRSGERYNRVPFNRRCIRARITSRHPGSTLRRRTRHHHGLRRPGAFRETGRAGCGGGPCRARARRRQGPHGRTLHQGDGGAGGRHPR